MIDYNIENELNEVLVTGERLLWSGKPQTGIIFKGFDIFFIPFSFLWCGLAIFWEAMAVGHGAPFFFGLFGIPFVCIGLYMAIGRFFMDAYKRSKTIYGITTDRIIIKSGIFDRSVTSLNIKALQDISYSRKANGSGTITLAASELRSVMMQGMDWPGVKQPPRLDSIEDVKAVYDQIIHLQRQI